MVVYVGGPVPVPFFQWPFAFERARVITISLVHLRARCAQAVLLWNRPVFPCIGLSTSLRPSKIDVLGGSQAGRGLLFDRPSRPSILVSFFGSSLDLFEVFYFVKFSICLSRIFSRMLLICSWRFPISLLGLLVLRPTHLPLILLLLVAPPCWMLDSLAQAKRFHSFHLAQELRRRRAGGHSFLPAPPCPLFFPPLGAGTCWGAPAQENPCT